MTPEAAGFRAGLRAGDRLFSWCRTAGGEAECVARGDLRTPFDWGDVEIEDAQRGGVVVEGARGSETRRWSLLPVVQGITVAPLLQGALAEAYQASREREQAGDPASAAQELEHAAELASGNHCDGAELWLRDQAARLRARAQQWSEVDTGYRAALAKARALKADRLEAHLHVAWWEALWQRGEIPQARQELEEALRLEEQNRPESLFVVWLLRKLGATADMQDNLEESGRLTRRAYDLVLRIAPGSGTEAATANNLGAMAGTRGDLAQAELYMARSLAILEKLDPADSGMEMNLWNYGELLLSRGDFAGAEAAFLRAKRMLEREKPESVELATTLGWLGLTAHQRGDHAAAESFLQRQMTLLEKLDPSGIAMRDRIMEFARSALLQDQGRKAEELWQRALDISEKLNPMGPKSASCLVGLAEAVRLQGRSSEAEQLLQRAMAIWQEINPESVDAGSIHLKLGILLLERNDLTAAEAHLRAAIQICETHQYRGLLPEIYQALARLQARRGQAAEAAASYLAAVEALEAQRTRLGGAQESRWFYGSSLGDLYFEAAEHQMALGRPQEAWKFIERGRARGFQEMLAQKDLRFASELPAGLYAERHRLDTEYDRALAALADWVPAEGAEKRETLEGRLRDLRLEQAEIQKQIEHSSPRIGALESSPPLDLAAARSVLDPGTMLLTYAVGESRSYLFVIPAAGALGPDLYFYPLAIGKEDLKREVEAFRSLLDRPYGGLAALKERGGRLYDLLIRPAEPVLAKADRWLISPDGPLHSLPFAALVSHGHYLAESKPIHIAASAAVYKELKAARSKEASAPATELLAVGDPLYPAGLKAQAEKTTDPQVRSALRRGLQLKPLPATRGEVEAISRLFPGAQTLLSRDATEEKTKSLAPQARRLHFACHGLLDERFPLNSALALSIPEHPEEGRDNGLLQAWEIFDSVRLDADLVTLSACDSGLGKEMGGEGLVGLVRAFQFAGARSVVASLWSISDVSTLRFMKSFYGYLHSGKTKDEALRAAQIDQIRGKSGSPHPFHWAAFELFGDWR
ncbi:MAG TPA: CHAT domain-containing protein [Thermoanaerobaculia bacterium]